MGREREVNAQNDEKSRSISRRRQDGQEERKKRHGEDTDELRRLNANYDDTIDRD